MKKIPTLFIRDPVKMSLVTREVNPVAQWVIDGEGFATQKMDGACSRLLGGELWKRRALKPLQPEPEGFVLAEFDENTGKAFGWMPVTDDPEDRYFREAYEWLKRANPEAHEVILDGTYEVMGPKVQGNPEKYPMHVMYRHANPRLRMSWQPPRDFDGIATRLSDANVEGFVWHHEDGRMVKIKTTDFGIRRS